MLRPLGARAKGLPLMSDSTPESFCGTACGTESNLEDREDDLRLSFRSLDLRRKDEKRLELLGKGSTSWSSCCSSCSSTGLDVSAWFISDPSNMTCASPSERSCCFVDVLVTPDRGPDLGGESEVGVRSPDELLASLKVGNE